MAQLIQFLSSIWLARLLSPADYGIFAIIYAVSSFASFLNDFGISEALIKERSLEFRQANAAFWVNLLTGCVLFAASVVSAPAVAAAFDEPRLVVLFPLSCFAFVISTNAVQIAILQRHRRFGVIAAADVVFASVTAATTTAIALLGGGVLSLVAGLLAGSSAMACVFWREVHWRVEKPRLAEMRAVVRRSSGNVGFSMASAVGHSVDTVAIGVVSTVSGVGAYNRAYNLARMPGMLVGSILNRVLMPVYADLRSNTQSLRRVWRSYTARTMLLMVPGAALMSVHAETAIDVLYGPNWEVAGRILQTLAWIIPPFAFASLIGQFLYLSVRQRVVALVGAVQAAVFATCVAVGALWGAAGVVWGVLIASYVGHVPVVVTCARAASLRVRDIAASLAPSVVTALAILMVGVAARGQWQPLPALLATAVAYVVIVPAAIALLTRQFSNGLNHGKP